MAGDLNEFRIEKVFDIILCLNVLQHMKSVEATGSLLDRLQESAADRLLSIVPITNAGDAEHQHETRNHIEYLLLSRRFFERKFGDRAAVFDLLPSCCGANRALIVVNGKTRRAASSIGRGMK